MSLNLMNSHATMASCAPPFSWRKQAARIVEDLFAVTPTKDWNALLDLRQQLLSGSDWNHTFDLFLACREQLEMDHYLPFYRLRRLLTASLRLETGIDSKSGVTALGGVVAPQSAFI